MPRRKIGIVSPEVFTLEELKQYEQRILDNKALTEQEASIFFSEFPKFLTVGGYAEIEREVVLYKCSGEPIYRVDFCRRKYGDIFWDFIELKHPKAPFVIKRGKHWKFSADIESGIHQAQDYRDFLETDLHRIELEKRTGIRAFRPKILLVGGRRNKDIDPIEMKKLVSRYNNIDIHCYDDIYNFASEAYKTKLIVVPIIQDWDVVSSMTGEETMKLLQNWQQTFWYWREDVGFGDSFQIENERLQKNLEKLRDGILRGDSAIPRIIRSFANDYGSWPKDLEEIIVRFERDKGVTYKQSEMLDYSEYLTY